MLSRIRPTSSLSRRVQLAGRRPINITNPRALSIFGAPRVPAIRASRRAFRRDRRGAPEARRARTQVGGAVGPLRAALSRTEGAPELRVQAGAVLHVRAGGVAVALAGLNGFDVLPDGSVDVDRQGAAVVLTAVRDLEAVGLRPVRCVTGTG
jgi:hypothetical protein